MSLHKEVLHESQVWLCSLCQAKFFLLDQAAIACPTCGNADPAMLELEETEEDDHVGTISPGTGATHAP